MGFLDDYDVDLDDFNDSGGFDVPDGTYAFEVTTGETKVGTQKNDDDVHIVIKLSLESEEGEIHSYNWWLKVPDDPSRPSRRESIAMSDWKKWLLGAGFPPEDIGGVGPEDIEGITGTMQLLTGRPNKEGRAYQNPRNWTFDGVEEEEEEKPKKSAKPAPAKSTKAVKPKPAPKPEEDEEGDEEAAEAPSATRTRAKGNPFAKKS